MVWVPKYRWLYGGSMLRLIGIILDDIIDNEEVIKQLIDILSSYKRSAKLLLYNKNIDDITLAKFVKKYEDDLIGVGTKITKKLSETCYYLIIKEKDNKLITGYSLCYTGDHSLGLEHFKELIQSEDARKRFIS